MQNAKQVDELVARLKAEGKTKAEIAWQAALACVGWPYVFGARGEYCTVQNRHRFYSDAHPTIRTKCQGYDSGSCSGCKWYPKSERVRMYDCRGFTYWILKQVGIPCNGSGATSQWNDENNWEKKGTVAGGIPKDTLVCLFVRNGKTMEHTGLGLNDETVECSNGVQHFTTRKSKWTDWAVPKGLYGEIPEPVPQPEKLPTLRKGNKNAYVTQMQTMLDKLGYSLGSCGIDGDFGTATQKAVKEFQRDHRLDQDGVCGPKTWEALQAAVAALTEKPKLWTVTISGLTKEQAEELKKQNPSAVLKEEEAG